MYSPDRAPGRCRAGAGLLSGKASPARLPLRRELIIVQDRGDAAVLGEQQIAAVAEQIQVEVLVGLLLAVAVDLDGDRLRRLAGGEGQCAGLGESLLPVVAEPFTGRI